MIDLNWTLVAAGAVFLFTLWGLNKLLYKPLLHVLDERRARTVDVRKFAAEKLDYHEALFDEYSEKIKLEKQKGYARAETSRKEALEERKRLIGEARSQADALREKARSHIVQEAELVKQKLERNAEEIAEIIAAQVLEKS